MDDFIVFLEQFLKEGIEFPDVDGGGMGKAPVLLDESEEVLASNLPIFSLPLPHDDGERDGRNGEFLQQFRREIGGGFNGNGNFAHKGSPLMDALF